MHLEFCEVSLDQIGKRTADARLQWGRVNLVFLNQGTKNQHVVSATVALSNDPAGTLGDLQADARSSAIELLEAALRQLRSHSLQDLHGIMVAREAAEEADLAEKMRFGLPAD